MYGLEVVARGSKSLIEKNREAALFYFSGIYNRDDDERNWSFSYLRAQLTLRNCQHLFRKYQKRVQHALFVELLAFNVVYNTISLFAYIFFTKKDGSTSVISNEVMDFAKSCRGISLFTHIIIFGASFREDLFKNDLSKIVMACIVLLCMMLGEMGTSIYRVIVGSPESTIRQTYYIVLTTTVLLPFPRKLYSGISGAAVITLDLMLSSLSNIGMENFTTVMLADTTFHSTTLAVGLGIRYLIEVMSRRAFLDRRECLESKIKIETERYREDKFLHSILPKYIASEVRQDIRIVTKDRLEIHHKPFNKLYVENHKDVSILYADIVNSVLLTTRLKALELVETLDELFGRFDESVEKNNCTRIKLLGDCYYCVSGVPDQTARHADNCVATGLDMIEIIRTVREKRSVNVDMRIGVHSGKILCGLLGLRKWQFDIWSKDASIASYMEQSGVPGQVHITKTTKDCLQDDDYDIYPGTGHLSDEYLKKEAIETFLIRPRSRFTDADQTTVDATCSQKVAHFNRSISVVMKPGNIRLSKERQSSNDSFLPMERRGALVSSLPEYMKMQNKVNEIMGNSIDKMALSKKDQWLSSVGIQPLFLTFRDSSKELPFLGQPDPLFKYYLLFMVIIFLGITVIHILILSSTVEFWVTYGLVLAFTLTACIPAWAGYIWLSIKGDETDQLLNSTVLKISRKVWKTATLRIVIWLVSSSTILFCSIAGLNECIEDGVFNPVKQSNVTTEETANYTNDTNKHLNGNPSCDYPWFYTLCAVLAMTTTSVFLRIHFLMKLVMNGVFVAVLWLIIDIKGEDVFNQQTAKLAEWEELGFPTDRSHCYYLIFAFLILHMLDRQIEYVCRLDYIMKVKLKTEQEEAHAMEMVNRVLLHNILPPHVCRFYLNKQLEEDSERVDVAYHEEHDSVAVLFASIPNFADFYYEDSQNEQGLRCIQLLNEIICDFDLLLSENEFSTVEKIKTIGSTYMAACDLQAYLKIFDAEEEEDPVKNVVTLVKYSVAMMRSLQDLNKNAMQDFQLRIGISVGPVMAGVVGTMKPQYDIWGDTVNIASRMDSTGVLGKIQVTKEVADLLSTSDCQYKCECRGETFVKGKGMLTTYFVNTEIEPEVQDTAL